MGGTKRKIPIEWIEDKNRRAVTFTKRRQGIFSKAAELCQLSGAQIAILVTPVSSESHVSFYSFGHSSVDSVISAFLNNERPREVSSKFWWEDESLAQSEDPNELRCAINSISSILHRVEASRAQKQREASELVLHGNQTLDNIPSTSGTTSLCLDEDYHHVQGEEQITADDLLFDLETQQLVLQEDQTLDCDNDYLGLEGNNGEGQEQTYNNNNDLDLEQGFSLDEAFDFETNTQGTLMMNLDDMDQNPNPFSAFEQDDGTLVMVHTDSDDAQLVSNISDDDLLNNLNQELDLDQNNSELGLLEDAQVVNLDQDNLRFSDYFNDLPPISDLPTTCIQELDFDQIHSLEDVSMVTNMCSDSQVVTHRDLDSDFFNDLTPIVAL